MAYVVRIVNFDSSIFNYVAKSRDDFIMQEVAKGRFPNQKWNWQLISSQNAGDLFTGDLPPEITASFARHLTAIAATCAGKTKYYSCGTAARPSFLDIAWQWLTHDAESVEEWETPFVIMDAAEIEQGRCNMIFEALAAAEALPEWEIHLPAPDGSTNNSPLFTS